MEEGGQVSPNENRAAEQPPIVNPNENRAAEQPPNVNPNENRAAEQHTVVNLNENRAAEQPTIVNVKLGIRSQDGTELYYRLPRDKKLKAMLKKYCEDKNVEYEPMVFLYDGRYVKPTNTAAELGLADGDIIDAMMYQYGGGLSGLKATSF